MNRREILASSAALLAVGRGASAAAQTGLRDHFQRANGALIIDGEIARHPLRVIDKITHAPIGQGQPIYALVSSRCPHSQALVRKHGAGVPHLETRFIPVTLDPAESGEVAQFYWDTGVDRATAIANFRRYMALGYRGAPPAHEQQVTSPTITNSDQFYSLNLSRLTRISRAFTSVHPEFRGFQTPMILLPGDDAILLFRGDHLPAISQFFGR